MQKLFDRLKTHFPLGDITEQRENLAFISVERAQLRALLLHLRDVEGYSHLVLLTAVDWLEEGELQLTDLRPKYPPAYEESLRLN